jgi:hypothetical protein
MQFEEESPQQYVDIARVPDEEMRPERPVPSGCGQDGMDARRTAQAGLSPESNSGDSRSIWSSRATKQTPVLAATRRDGALWAHFFVGNPRNIDIFLRALLLELHPISPPSHTCPLLR